MSDQAPHSPPPKRRWLRFSLRGLLAFVLVGAIAGLAGREYQKRRQDQLERHDVEHAMKEAWLRNDQGNRALPADSR